MRRFALFLVLSLLQIRLFPHVDSLFSGHFPRRNLLQQGNGTNTTCPLDFSVLRRPVQQSGRAAADCRYIRRGLRLVQAQYLRRSGFFLPPLSAAESCWESYQDLVNQFVPNFDIRRRCGFQTPWIAQGCMNITTRGEFEGNVSRSSIDNVSSDCRILSNSAFCATCNTALSTLQASYLTGSSVGNVSDCTDYPLIYAAAIANQAGPTDTGTAQCLFALDFTILNSNNRRRRNIVISVVVIGCSVTLLLGLIGFLILRRKRAKSRRRTTIDRNETELGSGLDAINGSTSLVRFTFDDIKQSTRNFSRENIIGSGGYGNVYRGTFPDGSEVALKRFKNCSAGGDAAFAHEVEVIASVRHVNLVALRGYCIATTPFEGHQRIIVCDLMRNGSLHDHLFGPTGHKLNWPLRRKIALGTARGLAYLHQGAQPGIIHRDIKASNILLDENFEAKVADFGLAKFTPEGMTHLSTRVAGTMGYVAPEYALYGQLTERSDVYSYGVLLLEILSGKKAIVAVREGQPALVTDWAWSLVRKGRVAEVIDEGMEDVDSPEVMEKYVLVALLCAHPQLYARPMMDQVVKILESEVPAPAIPDRPLPLIADRDDIERSVSSSGSGHFSSSSGYRPYTFENERPLTSTEDSGGR